MCGIAGIAGSLADRHGVVGRMLASLSRRGPDGVGQHEWPGVSFGHRRLAIFDLSPRGAQPMLSPDGLVGVTFNGAIYNFKALREELRGAGFEFQTETDTEVLVHGYRHWKIDGLVARLRGMFAFAIWDESRHELFLVRDRLGVKPLTYAMSGNIIGFASTVRALHAAGFGDSVNPQAVADFLEWGVVPEQSAIHLGLAKLPPATIGRWRNGRLDLTRYWSPPLEESAVAPSFPEAIEHTEALLLEAVACRVEADVPVGALLSGGVDSALVCWALRECGHEPNAFTFSAPGEPEDETEDARLTASELGIGLTVLPAATPADAWESLVSGYPEPFACGSAMGMLRLSEAARPHVTVLLTGDGGDDVFLGYPHHRFLHSAEKLARGIPPAFARTGLRLGLEPPARGLARRARHFAGYALGGLGAFLRARDGLRHYAKAGLIGPRLAGLAPSSHHVAPAPGSGRQVLGDYLDYAREHQFVAEYLAKVDGATMFYALEARSPFLDHRLWEFASTLPASLRLHGGQLKAILRAIARRRISERVAAGRKRGFEVPIGAWLRGPWSQRTRELLADPLVVHQGWISAKGLAAWREGTPVGGVHLWQIVVLELWLRSQAANAGTA